jgi:hypothetical protein
MSICPFLDVDLRVPAASDQDSQSTSVENPPWHPLHAHFQVTAVATVSAVLVFVAGASPTQSSWRDGFRTAAG